MERKYIESNWWKAIPLNVWILHIFHHSPSFHLIISMVLLVPSRWKQSIFFLSCFNLNLKLLLILLCQVEDRLNSKFKIQSSKFNFRNCNSIQAKEQEVQWNLIVIVYRLTPENISVNFLKCRSIECWTGFLLNYNIYYSLY